MWQQVLNCMVQVLVHAVILFMGSCQAHCWVWCLGSEKKFDV